MINGRFSFMKALIGIFSASIVLMALAGTFIYQVTAKAMRQQLGNQCLGIATAISVLIEEDIEGYLDFIKTRDTNSTYYQEAKKQLEKVRYTNDANIRFLYTEVCISDHEMMFVLDGEYTDAEFFSPPGSIDQLTETRRQAYQTQTSFVGESFTENSYGRLLSAYAAIYDRSGQFVGLVGVDVSAEQYDAVMWYQRMTIGSNILFLTFVMSALSYALFRVHNEKLQADQESKSKSSFLARMSHEIRTPMNAIMGMSELLLREQLPPAAREQAVSVRHASANLLAIINDILDFSKIESGKLEIVEEPYQFSSMLNDVISIIRTRLTDKPILFTTDIDCRIPNEMIGDEVRLRQILLNVLSNAVKYTDEGEVFIAITGSFKSVGAVELTIKVADTGIGIREDKMEQLFDDFVRMDTKRNQNVEGTGLGLAITRSLCTAMGGTIQAASSYGLGSIFTINLKQRFKRYARFAEVKHPETKSLMVYETRSIYGASVCAAAENLGVHCVVVESQAEFQEQLQHRFFSHILAASFLYDSARKMIRKQNLPAILVLLTDYSESVLNSSTYTLAMPVHTLSLANVLNGESVGSGYQERVDIHSRFIAPDARVLIADDVNTNLKVVEGLLAPFRMMVDCVLSGSEAVELIQQNHYDLVLMDHMMPEMDGIEATERIRKLAADNDYYRNLPIIAVTANAVSGMKEMFLKNGMSDFLAKPIETEKLYLLLEKWIPKEKQERAAEVNAAAAGAELMIDGIDVKAGIAMIGGSVENYFQVLEVFCRDSVKKSGEIRQSLDQSHWKLFTVYVHAVKGAAASIGALELAELASALELAGSREDADYIRDYTEAFLEKLMDMVAAIEDCLLQPEGIEEYGTENDIRLLVSQLEVLRQALADIDIRAADQAVEKLRAGCWTKGVKQKLDQIYELILMFEYESAGGVIDELLSS